MEEPEPDLFSAGAERMTYETTVSDERRVTLTANTHIETSVLERIVFRSDHGGGPTIIIGDEDVAGLDQSQGRKVENGEA